MATIFLTWLLSLSLHDVEVVGAFGMLVFGLTLDLRLGIHIRLRYLTWRGGRDGPHWGRQERVKLRRLTYLESALAFGLTGAGFVFFAEPRRVLQLGVTIGFLILVWFSIEATRKVIQQVGGPPPASDVIGSCKPVRALRNPDRVWNGKWGLDTVVDVLVAWIPVGHRAKVAVLLLVGLFFSASIQSGATLARWAQESAPKHSGRNHRIKSQSGNRSKGGDGHVAGGVASELEYQPQLTPYEVNCGTELTPGDGAPTPLARRLNEAWQALGVADGCAVLAHEIPSGAYLVKGQCQGKFWSMGIVSWHYPAAVMIEYAALAAMKISRSQELLGASSRENIGGGDFHLVYTPAGPFMLIREEKTDGEGGPEGIADRCADLQWGGEKYVSLSPGMAELLLRLNERSDLPIWPVPEEHPVKPPWRKFAFQSNGTEVASGYCDSPAVCFMSSDWGDMRSSSAGVWQVTVGRVRENGPD